jgi:hypothetical protein
MAGISDESYVFIAFPGTRIIGPLSVYVQIGRIMYSSYFSISI